MTFTDILTFFPSARKNGVGYVTHCPAHDDKHPSLRVGEGDDGRTLLKCFAGCETANIVAALGLTLADLFPEPIHRAGLQVGRLYQERAESDERRTRATIAGLAERKRLSEQFLLELGLRDGPGGVVIPLVDLDENHVGDRTRQYVESANPTFWDKNRERTAYHRGRQMFEKARTLGYIVFVEGESDCWTLWFHGIPAVGVPGSSMTKHILSEHVASIPRIFLSCEPDKGGTAFVASAATRLRAVGYAGEIRVLDLKTEHGVKDPSDLHIMLLAKHGTSLEQTAAFHGAWKQATEAAQLYTIESPKIPPAHHEAAPKWTLQSAAEIYREGVPPLTYDIDQLLPSEDGPAIFFGPPGSLKSYLALHAAVCSVTGEPFLGHFSVRKRPAAIYVNLDAGNRTFQRRVLKSGFHGDSLYVTSPDGYDARQLRRVFEQFPGAFIVIDAFADCFDPKSGDDQAQIMRRFIREMREIYSEHGSNGLIVDHPRRPKDGESHADYYGSIQKEATARIMWTATRLPTGSDQSEVKVKIASRKMSEGEPFEPFVARCLFGNGVVTCTYDGTMDTATGRVTQGPTDLEIIEQLLRGVPEGMSRSAIQSRTRFSRDAVLSAIKESTKIAVRGKARSARYFVPESSALLDDSPDDSNVDWKAALPNRTESFAPLDGHTITDDTLGDLPGAQSYGDPNNYADNSSWSPVSEEPATDTDSGRKGEILGELSARGYLCSRCQCHDTGYPIDGQHVCRECAG